tara:strand:- start:672 stop:815 length:144 start_codon:yes stop_codon:yes gene_type:complete
MKQIVHHLPEGAKEIIMYKGNIFYECNGIIYKKENSSFDRGYQIVVK